MPRPQNPKIPLINLFASIRGRLTLTNAASADGMFGPNVWTVPSAQIDQTFPLVGQISGTARITSDALTTLVDPIPPNVRFYRDDLRQFDYFGAPSRLGYQGSGDFSIDGIDAPGSILGDPREYDIVFEDSDWLGVSGGPVGNQAEWFSTALQGSNPPIIAGLYSGNPLTSSFSVNAFGQVGQNPPVNFAPSITSGSAARQVASLSVLPGTIIHLSPRETARFTPGGLAAPDGTQGAPAPMQSREQVVRPLVSIAPRTGRFAAQNLTVTVRDDFYSYDIASARVFVNGVLSQGLLTGNGPTSGTAVGATTWTIPMTAVLGSTSSNTPVRVQFLIRAASGAVDPFTGLQVVAGTGRNDVIL